MLDDFDDAKFSICMEPYELDDMCCDSKHIVVKQEFNCFCYWGTNRPTEYFVIKDNKVITYRKLIQELCKQKFDPVCDHKFFEGIRKTDNTESIEYIMCMGS